MSHQTTTTTNHKPNKITIPSHALTVRLDLRRSHSVPNHLRGACIRSILFHILYSRGIFPCPAEDLLPRCSNNDNHKGNSSSTNIDSTTTTTETTKEAGDRFVSSTSNGTHHPQQRRRQQRERHRKRGALARVNRKMEQNARRLRGVLYDLEELLFLFDHNDDDDDDDDGGDDCRRRERDVVTRSRRIRHEDEDMKAVLITIGPSFASPREQYLLRFYSWSRQRQNTNSSTRNRSDSHNSRGVCHRLNGTPTPTPERQKTETQQQQQQQRKRMEQEIGRRSVRELIQGTLSEEHSKTFETTSSSGGGSGGTKVSIAVLLTKDAINSLFDSSSVYSPSSHCEGEDGCGTTNASPNNVRKRPHSILSSSSQMAMIPPIQKNNVYGRDNDTDTADITNRIVIRRNFDIKTPRILSKRRNLHRPFVVFDVIPMMKPPSDCGLKEEEKETEDGGDSGTKPRNDDVGFWLEDGDTWVSLNSFIKGFRI